MTKSSPSSSVEDFGSPLRWPQCDTPARHGNAPLVLHTRVVTGNGGGPDKTILRSARYANASGMRITSAYMFPRGDDAINTLRDNARTWGCRMWALAESTAVDPRTLQRLLGLCRQLGVSIWHGHDYKSNLYGLLLRRRWPMKLVTTVHGWTRDTPRTRFYYHIDNWCLSRYDHIITVNPTLTDHCRQLGISENRITYISNAIEPDEYQPHSNPLAVRNGLGIKPQQIVIGVVSRLSCEKGVDRAIRAIALLRQTGVNAHLHLIGDGPQRRELEALVNDLGIADAVRFWGWQDHPKRFYTIMDVLLIPSHTEGMPNAAMEAMAMGIPVAATDVGGIGELLERGRCGVLLNQDYETWPQRLTYLLNSTNRRQTIAQLARTRIEKKYNFKDRMEKVFKVYRQILPSVQIIRSSPQVLRKAA